MNMSIKDALSILAIEAGLVTPDEVKKAYQRAASKYHPDRNPAGLEVMKLVNVAYELLKDYHDTVEETHDKNYGDAVNEALNAIIDLGLTLEICGSWLWVCGNTKLHKETLKTAHFRWSPKKESWYFRPEEYKSFNRKAWSMDKIRANYGSQFVHRKDQEMLARC